jgi:hypothetical protein
MEKKNKIKYLLITLSVISALGVGYFIYDKIKISKLNKKISTLEDANKQIDDIETEDIVIPADVSKEPELPPYSGDDDIVPTINKTTVIKEQNSAYYPLKKGSNNIAVGDLQRLLNYKGQKLVVDNDFGAKTEAALFAVFGKKQVSSATEFASLALADFSKLKFW